MAMERYYRPELDVLRCFAFLMVFASHTVPVSTAAAGAFGVDLFFTLSSFLITTLLLRESSVCGALDVTAFYLRRVLRILPLYFGFLLAATTLARSLVPDENLPLKYVVAFALLCGNWACVLWGYPHSVASPLWSVSIEEQFYLCWPLIMRRWVHRLTMVAVGLVVVSFVTRLCLVLHGAVHPQIWCNTLARLDPIACGALLAVRQDKRKITLSPRARSESRTRESPGRIPQACRLWDITLTYGAGPRCALRCSRLWLLGEALSKQFLQAGCRLVLAAQSKEFRVAA